MNRNSPIYWSPLKVAVAACAAFLILGGAWYSTSRVISGVSQLFSGEDEEEQTRLESYALYALFAEAERIASIDDVEGARKLVQDNPKNKVLHWQLTSQLIAKQCWNSLVAVVDSLILDEPYTPSKILSEAIKNGCSVEVAKQIGNKGFKLDASQVIGLIQQERYEQHVLALLIADCAITTGLEQYPGGMTTIRQDLRGYRAQIQAIPEPQRANVANVLARLAIRVDAEQWTWLLEYCGTQQRNEILSAVVRNGSSRAVNEILSKYDIDVKSFSQFEQDRIKEYVKLDSRVTASTKTSSTETGALHQLEYLAEQGYSASQFDEIFDKFPQVMSAELSDYKIPVGRLLFQNRKYFAVRSLEKRGAKLDPSWVQDAKYRFFCACNEETNRVPSLIEELGKEALSVATQKYYWGRGVDWHLTPLQYAVRTSNVPLFESLCRLDASGTLFRESLLQLLKSCPPSLDNRIRKSILAVLPKYHRANGETFQELITEVLPEGIDSLKKIKTRADLPIGLHELPELFDGVLASKDLQLFDWYMSMIGQENESGKRVLSPNEETFLFDRAMVSPDLVERLLVAGCRPSRDNFRMAVQQYKPEVIRILLTDLSLLVVAGKELEDAIATIPQSSELGELLREKNQLRLAIQAIPQISN